MSEYLKVCPNCGTRVWPMPDGVCPACRVVAFPASQSPSAATPSPLVRQAAPPSGQVMPKSPVCHTPPEVDPRLAGIGGWLLIPAIGMPIGVVLGGISLLLFTIGVIGFGPELDPPFVFYVAVRYLVELLLYIWFVVIVIKFFQKRAEFPRIIITFLWTQFGLMLACFVLGWITLPIPESDAALIILLLENNFLAAALGAAIWIPYFKRSKRVKATFVN